MNNPNSAILTVGQLKAAIAPFDDAQPVRVSVPEDFDRTGAHPAQISNNIHEWGMLHNDLWSDGCYTHATVQIPLLMGAEEVNHDISDEYLVTPSEDDPEGLEDYW